MAWRSGNGGCDLNRVRHDLECSTKVGNLMNLCTASATPERAPGPHVALKPRRSKRPMISETRPRWTPSGLIMMKERSADILESAGRAETISRGWKRGKSGPILTALTGERGRARQRGSSAAVQQDPEYQASASTSEMLSACLGEEKIDDTCVPPVRSIPHSNA